ncbi:MAG TPA: tRNA (guanosine(46)-N7)-methyltransferase TrmB [Thermoanaerobaculia bacterium]|nr:tRNA (guanosine(46)-N7)-methyltransferase TrmB [Thermoanaerobaculia bacterium]
MIQPVQISTAAGDRPLAGLPAPLPLDELVPGTPENSEWEVEIGFGKGRYLLRRAQEDPRRRFLGIELAGEYHGIFVERARRRGLANWIALRGEAQYLLSSVLPAGFASALHVYFPDPWPKSRHHKRRLFDPETVDLVLGLLRRGGHLYFATDFLDYGELVFELLSGYPGLRLARRDRPWDEGPRTNYEAKYEAEGRPILRLEGVLEMDGRRAPLHPAGAGAVLSAMTLEEDRDG